MKFRKPTSKFKSRIFHSPFSIFHFPFFLALASAAIAADAGAWRLDPVGWREDGGTLESRSAGFAFAEAAPAEALEFHARENVRPGEIVGLEPDEQSGIRVPASS